MRYSRIKSKSRMETAFSLIEIMIALAIIALGLIAIIGLIPQGVTASRNAADNTFSATIAHDVFDTIRSKPFANVDLSALGFMPTIYNLQNTASGLAYYDQQGFSPATPQDNYYAVSVTFTPAPAPQTGISQVRATVTWPAKTAGSASAANTNIFFTQVANYQ